MFELDTAHRADAEMERRAVDALERLELVRINGVYIDFRGSELSGRNWKPLGVEVRIYPDCVLLRWLRPDTIGWRPEIDDGYALNCGGFWHLSGDAAYFSTTLYDGDYFSIERITFLAELDPALSKMDRALATGVCAIRRCDGAVEHRSDVITFASPLLVQSTRSPFLIDPGVNKLILRLMSLKHDLDMPEVVRERVVRAVNEAERRQILLEKCHITFIRECECLVDESASVLLKFSLESIQEAAAAFGYAVGLAEAEAAVRSSARALVTNRSRGGKTTGSRKTEAAKIAWQDDVLKWAEMKDFREGKNWPRSKFAQEILFQFEGKVPGLKQIEKWLAKHAEAPNGPLRSRHKNRVS